MNQIRFKAGEFQGLTATRDFGLGNFGVKVLKGREVEFDGGVVRYDGSQYQFPQFRSALTAGWVVPSNEYDANNPVYQVPMSANIKVRPTTTGAEGKTAATTVEADERIIMSAEKHAANTRQQNRPGNNTTRLAGNSGVAEAQDGVPVRSLKTAAKNKTSLNDAGAALRAVDSVTIDAGQGVTEDEMLARMSEDERKAYLSQKVRPRLTEDEMIAQMSDSDREVYLAQKGAVKSRYVDSSSGVKVGEVKTAGVRQADGMKLTQTVGGGTEISDGVGDVVASIRKDEVSTRVEDGITFTNTNGPRKAAAQPAATTPVMMRDGTADVRLQIAKTLCPEFPQSYDFAAPEKKKLARLQADFEDRPDVIRAVFAAETDGFKAKLMEEFPQAFRG